MKVLGINSSPNLNGSTAKIIDMFLNRCIEKGAETERIDLQDYMIENCENCLNCTNNEECIYNDDFLQLKAKMLNYDGIIIASPYFSGKASENLEALVERLVTSSQNRKYFTNKYFVGLSVSLNDSADEVAKYCASLGGLINNNNGTILGTLSVSRISDCGIGEVDEDEKIKDKIDQIANKLIKNLLINN
ncbi:MAG: flavodoxin family protein [Clostridiales bacterium]